MAAVGAVAVPHEAGAFALAALRQNRQAAGNVQVVGRLGGHTYNSFKDYSPDETVGLSLICV